MAKVCACEEYFEILNPGVMQSTFTLLVLLLLGGSIILFLILQSMLVVTVLFMGDLSKLL